MTIATVRAYVGSYGAAPGAAGGGIYAFEVSPDGGVLTYVFRTPEPREAGYLLYAPDRRVLYAVDERKTDGRGPVAPAASVHAFSINANTGALTWLGARPSPGPRPTYLAYDAIRQRVISANHGDFQHIEKVRKTNGHWTTEYVYDDSTIVLFRTESDGGVGEICDVHVFEGHGRDPNTSPQNGGHAQASPHAHCAVIDPSGRFLLVCDKGTDCIIVFRLGDAFEIASVCQMPEETGPRHLAFDEISGLAYVTCEFSSELASLRFDAVGGRLFLLGKISTVAATYRGRNEPAEVRVRPGGGVVYVNNRGEDSLAWFGADKYGALKRQGDTPLAKSLHPGLAARSFTFDPHGKFVLVADRPANLVRSYALLPDGALAALTTISVPDPAFVALVEQPA